MQFTQPLFLIGYAAILIPILIHLFNFRKYKTYYFSNVKMLQDIAQKTKRESQLKHLIVLLLRILGIAALVTAFAQPFIPNKKFNTQKGNVVSIYVDNSFSMEGNTSDGTLFSDAITNAKEIINNFSYEDEFVLFNNDFAGQQSRLLNKDEALQTLDEWEISPNSKTWNEILSFEKNVCSRSLKSNTLHYYLSDFQKNNFDFSQFKHADSNLVFLVNLPAKQINNAVIDSCWFLTPVFRTGQEATLTVRVHNFGDEDIIKLPVKLYINDAQKALTAVDIKANSSADFQMKYQISGTGTQLAKIEIEDTPITFDDQLYFTYQVSSTTNISTIYEKTPNRFLDALYGKDSIFSYNAMAVHAIDYGRIKQSEVVILDEVVSITSGLANELDQYLSNGGTVIVLPNAEMSTASWNSFLNEIHVSQFGELVNKEMKVGSINRESAYYKGSMEKVSDNLDFPSAKKYFQFTQLSAGESIMTFDNRQPLLSAYNVGKGKLILSAVAMNDDFGNIHKHALFFIPMHNIGIRSIMQQKLYNIIGVDHYQSIRTMGQSNDDVIKIQNGQTTYIPEQRNMGNETVIYFHDQITQDGIYDVLNNGTTITSIAFNYDRKESQLNYYSEDEQKDIMVQQPKNVEWITSESKDITHAISERLNGKFLWQYFILFALVCFLAEILVLRLWGKFSIKKENKA